MQMPGRKYNTSKLINGFNGKRYDNDIYGEGNFQDYGMRMYETPRITPGVLKKEINKRILDIQQLIKKQAQIEKQAATQAIERTVDYLQDK